MRRIIERKVPVQLKTIRRGWDDLSFTHEHTCRGFAPLSDLSGRLRRRACPLGIHGRRRPGDRVLPLGEVQQRRRRWERETVDVCQTVADQPCPRRLQCPGWMMNFQSVGRTLMVAVIEAISLGEEVLE